MTQPREWATYQGRSLYDQDDAVIGIIEDFYIDPNGNAVWVLVYPGEPATQRSVVPLRDVQTRGTGGEDLQVSVGGDQVRNAPATDARGDLSEHDERRLYEHYDMPYPGQDAPAAGVTPGASDRDRSDTGEQPRKHRPGLLQRLLGHLTHREEATQPREKVEKNA